MRGENNIRSNFGTVRPIGAIVILIDYLIVFLSGGVDNNKYEFLDLEL
jgi:hypothetical protein